MLIRQVGESALLITQPAHAWVSGQLARAWAGDEFEPREEVCLAAEQHDIGWLTWEANPALNPSTGLPYSFREMPRREHIQVWTRARRYAILMNRYTALLISRHGTGLFERYGPGEDAPKAEQEQVEGFLRRERAAQHRLIDSLAEDPHYAEYVTDEVLGQNSSLISLWDGMSLMLCSGLSDDGVTIGDYTLTPGDEETSVLVAPWPFAEYRVSLAVQARRLTERFNRQITLQSALQRAEWLTIEFDLAPASE